MNQWKPIVEEHEGVHPKKIWITNGKERALFKPDTNVNESAIEHEVYKIATALDIPCAKIEIINFAAKRFEKMQEIYKNVLNNKNYKDGGNE